MKIQNLILGAALAGLSAVAFPTLAAEQSAQQPASAQAKAEGEVRKVDKSAGKLTIKHGPLANLDMPAMTMVFRVRDPAMLDLVQAGDRIRFVADKAQGAFIVTELEKVER